jgi:hypothetical protein
MRRARLYTVASVIVLCAMVALGPAAGRMQMPFAGGDSIKLWFVAAIGIAMVGTMLLRVGGELVLAILERRWKDLRLYERNLSVEEQFDSSRSLEQIIADVSERLRGMRFETQPPQPWGDGLSIVAEKPKTPESPGLLFNAISGRVDFLPDDDRVHIRVQLTHRTIIIGDVAADRRKIRWLARYIVGEVDELAEVRSPPVTVDMALVLNVALLVLAATERTSGTYGMLGEAAQWMAAICAGLGIVQIARNPQVTTGLATAIALCGTTAWLWIAHVLLWKWPALVESWARGAYLLLILAIMASVEYWWRSKQTKVSPVYRIPTPKYTGRSGWWHAILLTLGVLGAFMVGCCILFILETNGMKVRESTDVRDLQAGRWPKSRWVVLKGAPLWEDAAWTGAGSSKRYYVPVLPQQRGPALISGMIELTEKQFADETKKKIEEGGAEGIYLSGGLPEKVRKIYEEDRFRVSDDVLVVIYQRLPGDLRRDGLVLGAVGLVVLSLAGGTWRWLRRRKWVRPAVEEAVTA